MSIWSNAGRSVRSKRSPPSAGATLRVVRLSSRSPRRTDLRSGFDRFSPENLAANKPVVDLLARLAQRKGATPAQIALAWLTPDLEEIAAELPQIEVHGGRMSAKYMAEVEE